MEHAGLSSRSRLSHAVARLEENGWMRRRACPTDRRGAVAELADATATAGPGPGAMSRGSRGSAAVSAPGAS